MIRCEVIEQFTLKDFEKLKNIKRKSIEVKGTLFVGDTFECNKEMCDYLMGKNELSKTVVKVIEVEPIKVKKELVKSLEEAPKEDELTKEEIKYYKTKNKKSSKK